VKFNDPALMGGKTGQHACRGAVMQQSNGKKCCGAGWQRRRGKGCI
jgi:hypothetical protein